MRIPHVYFICIFTLLVFLLSDAGITNPDISALGQVFATYTDDQNAESPDKVVPSFGEAEVVFDAALNPFVRGKFVFSIGDEGFEVEEGYASFIRGLPLNLSAMIGKYRVPFGKLNTVHPHAYPFIRTPHVLNPEDAGLIPGEESFNELGADISTLIPLVGSWSIVASADFLQGNSFHPDTSANTCGFSGHLSNTFSLGDKIAADIGGSIAHGVNNPAEKTQTTVGGIDAKIKAAINPQLSLTIGSEFIYNHSGIADSTGLKSTTDHSGFYAYADTRIFTRYNFGVLGETWKQDDGTNCSIKPFAGFSILEESTTFRIAYEYLKKHDEDPVNTFEFQLLFMMGPHKAHQF
ncbi:MAG TPA: hypothetical protein VHO70_01190 [Chitinispirillaceae bacterium]|nr:hypothetical protein [Chitinispirillaceae bacterium]